MKRSLSALLSTCLLLSGCQEIFDLILTPEDISYPISDSYPISNDLSELDALEPGTADSYLGQEDPQNDMLTVSEVYDIPIQGTPGKTQEVAIPVMPELLSDGIQDIQFQPEAFNPNTQQWEATGQFVWYDQASQKVHFFVGLPEQASNLGEFAVGHANQAASQRFRIRIYLLSNLVTVSKEGSQFRIHYYPPKLASKHKVISDAQWQGNASQDPRVPDFVEDLDRELNKAYQALLKLKTPRGQLFSPLPIQDVYILDTGGNAGDSKLGGPMRLSNTRLKTLADLRLTASHELLHVFQGQYYSLKGLFSGNFNRWFIEATAHFYTALIQNLTPKEKKALYGEFLDQYLNVPITSSDESSLYAAAHFLDWLSQTYDPKWIGAVFSESTGNDLLALGRVIKEASAGKSTLGRAYADYLKAILTQPEKEAGLHLDIRNSMAVHAFGHGHLSGPLFSKQRTYITLQKKLAPLSSVLADLSFHIEDEGLLVVQSQSNGVLLESLSYGLSSERNADYTQSAPLDRYISPSIGKAFTLPSVGKHHTHQAFQQLLINTNPIDEAQVDMYYYVLRTPPILSHTDTEISWSSAQLGNIPPEKIAGFKVYGQNNGKWQDLSGLIPLETGQSTQTWPLAAPQEQVQVQILDQEGFAWPQIEASNEESSLEIILETGVDLGNLSPNQSVTIQAQITGLDDPSVSWELERGSFYKADPGQLEVNGNTAQYTAPDEFSDAFLIVRSVAKPELFKRIPIFVEGELASTGG